MLKKLSVKNNQKYSILPSDSNNIDISKSINGSKFIIGGSKFDAYCINCKELLCYEYNDLNFSLGDLEGMPYNNSKYVCPTNSIILTDTIVKIDNNCINCGICYSRCPVGAIYYSNVENKYIVNEYTSTENHVEEQAISYETFQNKEIINTNFVKVPQASISDLDLNTISNHNFCNVVTFSYNKNIKENELIRNYLFEFGYEAKSYSTGNNDNRIDCIGYKSNKYILCEIKLATNDYISLIRKALEDQAVFANKYNKSINDIDVVIFINQLPNKRSDFYELIKDIKLILDIEIHVIPIYFCDLLLKNGIRNFEDYIKDFKINSDQLFISSGYLDTILQKIDKNYGLEGVYTPLK